MNVPSSFHALRASITRACTTDADIFVSAGKSTWRNTEAVTGPAATMAAANARPATPQRLRLIMTPLPFSVCSLGQWTDACLANPPASRRRVDHDPLRIQPAHLIVRASFGVADRRRRVTAPGRGRLKTKGAPCSVMRCEGALRDGLR